jgi:hypothetical protein
MNIVCYTGGTCGDMISAILDSAGGYFTNNRVMFDQDRTQLKKPHLFNSDTEKDQYLIEAGKKYRSIPSHDLDYHIRRTHDFVGITVQNNIIALWAAERFKRLHRPHVWAEMTAACGAESIEDYAQMMIHFSNRVIQHTDLIITLESIRAGTALDNPILKTANKDFYLKWLDLQT